MLKTTLVLGLGAVVARLTFGKAFWEVVAWLLAMFIALALLALETLPVILPLLPKLVPSGLASWFVNLLPGGVR